MKPIVDLTKKEKKKNMKCVKSIFCTAVVMMAAEMFAAPYVTNVVAKQRSPWGIVDISCEVAGIEEETNGLSFIVEAVLPDSGVKKVSNVRFRGYGNQAGLSVTTNGNYQFVWNANYDLGTARYTNMLMRVSIIKLPASVQLWEDGPYWATTNIGAEKPEEYGCYFWWGDTVGYKRENDKWVASDGSNANFSFSESNTPTYGKSISALQSEEWITSGGVLAPEHDAATVHWGNGWRMPTEGEMSALVKNCDWTWTTQNGVRGYIFKGRGTYTASSIFLPAAGYGYGASLRNVGSDGGYWSSVPGPSFSCDAWFLDFCSSRNPNSNGLRFYGRTVRPLKWFTK